MAKAAEKVEQDQAEQGALFAFEGRTVQGRQIRFTGTVSLDDQAEVLHIGDTVRIEVFGSVVGVNHERRAKTGLVRDQKVEVDSLNVLAVTHTVAEPDDAEPAGGGDDNEVDNVRDLPLGAKDDEDPEDPAE